MPHRAQSFLKAVAEAQHFEATGGAAGGELPAGMTGLTLYRGNPGEMMLKPKARCVARLHSPCAACVELTRGMCANCFQANKSTKAGGAKAGGGGAKRGGGGGGSGVPRRVRVARFLGLLPPAGDGLQPLPILPCA